MRIARARYVGIIAPLAGLIAAVACKKTPPEAHSAPAVANAPGATAAPAAGGGKVDKDKPIDTVPPPGVDISKLDDFERKVFFRVINKEPSACGDPKSLLDSAKNTSCKKSVYGVKLVARLVDAGYTDSEIAESLQKRYR